MTPDDYCFLTDNVKYWVGRPRDIVSLAVSGNYTTVKLARGGGSSCAERWGIGRRIAAVVVLQAPDVIG